VIDGQNRIFNYKNLDAVGGAMLGAALGVNPCLRVAALAQRRCPSFHKPV
jgi:cholesterol oxidase